MAPDDAQTSTRDRPRRAVPTLEEVAALAGVSRSTASRAINGGARVSAAAQAAVDKAIAELSYTPNRAARSLVTRRTDSIALVIPEPDERVLTDLFFSATLNGLSSALASSDLQLVLIIARPGESDRTRRYLRNGHVDGAVVVSHHEADRLDTLLAESRLPAVFVGRPLNEIGRLNYVDVDNYGGGRIAAEHIVKTGRTRIGMIAGPQDMAAGRDRLRGWKDILTEHGHATDAVETSDFTTVTAIEAVQRLLAKHPDIDNYGGGRLAAEHIVKTGRTRIGMIAGPQDMAAGRDRLRGWKDMLTEHGLATDAVETSDFTTVTAIEAAQRLLDKHPDIDAIIAGSDLIAVGAIHALRERGLSVPDDVAVIGFDNLGVSTSPTLTTLTNPVVAMARTAGQLLLEILEDDDVEPQHKQFSPDLVVRGSTAPAKG